MKFQKPDHFTEKSSSVAGQNFNVSLSAKMFETFFSNMYRYKEAAVTRELTCNAYDAHNMRDRLYRVLPSHYQSLSPYPLYNVSRYLAPQGTKPIVHIPDMYEPYLEIKDFGIGLHINDIIGMPMIAKLDEVLIAGNIVVKEDQIPEGSKVIGEPAYYGDELVFRTPENEIIRSPGLYTTIFSSTKDNDNDQIGAYGLGSKSPFAVTDSFTVESRYEGQIHRFLMYLNESRIPCVDLVTKDLVTRDPKPISTEEYNGLTVNVPIKSSQYEKFSDELKKLCRVMETKDLPVITNGRYTASEITQIDREERISDTYIQTSKSSYGVSNHYAVMGGVAYPIDTTQLEENVSNLLRKFPSTYTFFQLGEFNVPPSREDITYDEFGRDALNNKFKLLREELLHKAITEVGQAATKGPLFQYLVSSKYIRDFGTGFKILLEEKFPPDERINSKGEYSHPSLPFAIKDRYSKYNKENYDYPISSTHLFRLSKFNELSRYDDYDLKAETFYGETKPIFVILDDPKTYIQKIKTLCKNTQRDVILISPNSHLITYRNLKLRQKYTNAYEIRKVIKQWVGQKEKVDFLLFADMFSEYYDGIINNDIMFMSELPYEKINFGNSDSIGLELVKTTNSSGNIKGTKVKLETVEGIIQDGKQIIYVEMSGHNIIHKIKMDDGSEIDITPQMVYSLFCALNSRGRVLLGDEYDIGVYTAKKMSLPLLKKHSDVFVPIDKVMKELAEKYYNIFVGLEYKRFSGLSKSLKYIQNNSYYLIWILEQIVSRYDDKKSSDLLSSVRKVQETSRSARGKVAAYEKEAGILLEPFKEVLRNSDGSFGDLSTALSPLLRIKGMDGEAEDTLQICNVYSGIKEKIANLLSVESYLFNENRNRGRHGGYYRSRSVSYKLDSRNEVRFAIEKYLFLLFVKEQYKCTMGNKLNGSGAYLEQLIRCIE